MSKKSISGSYELLVVEHKDCIDVYIQSVEPKLEYSMLYLVKRSELENGLNYYVEIDQSKSKVIARYRQDDKKIVSLNCNTVWGFDSKEIRVYGPIDVRRKHAPKAPVKLSRPNPKEVNIQREDVISYLGGVSADTLAKERGISREVFKKKLDQLGVLRKASSDSPLSYRQLVSYGQGLSISDIAKQGNMSEDHTLKKLRALGLSLENFELKNKVYRTDRYDFNLNRSDVSAYLEGTSTDKLANNYGTVSRVIKSKLEQLGVLRIDDSKTSSQ
ncbi:hypothetical protein [Pseudoalteromonas prydzensis]|uniref:hypothetical protein n=1 Tax=Pseudoalteromonas prydzensis TaxID=182141 RepID=UPI003FD4ABAC